MFRTILENGTPVLDEGELRLFPWWSLTKSVLAACALRLGHSGVGPGSVCAVYHASDRDPPVTVAVFSNDETEANAEQAAAGMAV